MVVRCAVSEESDAPKPERTTIHPSKDGSHFDKHMRTHPEEEKFSTVEPTLLDLRLRKHGIN
jgi:hypothetical protein